MKNPLIKRIPRELTRDWHKYLVIIVFMLLMIGVVSSMYVAHDSMMAAIEDTRSTGNLEDGRFEVNKELTDDIIEKIESGEVSKDWIAYTEALTGEDFEEIESIPVEIISHFFKNEEEDRDGDGIKDATVRVYKSDSTVDLATFNEGRAPENENEIAIDRMHADNVGLKTGDTIMLSGRQFKIVGLLSYVNYTTLHESTTDLMFDAFGFDVAMVTPEAFEKLEAPLHYNYVFMYNEKPDGNVEKADFAERFLKVLISRVAIAGLSLEDFVPEYLNQSSNFAPSDIEGDTAGAEVLIYILIAVIAFIFAITISTTIDKEASVIGTLRASGYTKGELVRHYMAMPVVVTIIGALLGNLGGYTVFKEIVVYLYYNSYSLPKYTTVWSGEAFIKTTLIPLILMLVINLFVIINKLKFSPLRFLRHDLKRTKRAKAVRLPSWSFLARFRLRVLFQNIPNYLVLIFGIVFIEIMLCFAFGFPDSLNHYAEEAPGMLFSKYQYSLTGMMDEKGKELTTATEGAEKFIATSLEQSRLSDGEAMRGASSSTEGITVYGYIKDSSYITIREALEEGNVYVSASYADKYSLKEGDKISLSEKYGSSSYTFTVAGVFNYSGSLAVFMPIENFNRIFGNKEGDFSGYFSDLEIKDISSKYIANVLTEEDVTKITNQLMHSMGGFMNIFRYALLVMSIALIYLLSKIIIEKNESPISMAKILGFKNSEISSLYMLPTAIMVFVFAILSFAVGKAIISWVFRIFMMQMDGWFTFYMSVKGMILTVLFIIIGYAVVSVTDFIRIKKIPLDEALKNIE
ncbi:MAG: ABC transporter permease [Lachnospiraceae bacterium]|nr:ABC transporter permease [Lachnospiraceae bacterium]